MSLNLRLRLKSRLCRPHEIRGMKQRELAIRIDEMRNTECKPCVNTQLNRLVENTQRQQHDGTHKAKYDCIIPFPLLLHQHSPFCTLQRPPSQPKKNIRFLMQILICSHDGVQDQVVDPVQFQTTWAIYRILRYTSCRFHALDFFLST